MNALVRRARDTEAAPLSELAKKTFADAFGHTLLPGDLAAHLDGQLSIACFRKYLRDDTILVAEFESRLIGFIQIGLARPGRYEGDIAPDEAELRRLYLLSDFQGRGLGSRLIDAAFQEPFFRQAQNIYLDVWERNDGAQKLYARYGFRVIGKRAFMVESGAETSFDLIMVRSRT